MGSNKLGLGNIFIFILLKILNQLLDDLVHIKKSNQEVSKLHSGDELRVNLKVITMLILFLCVNLITFVKQWDNYKHLIVLDLENYKAHTQDNISGPWSKLNCIIIRTCCPTTL